MKSALSVAVRRSAWLVLLAATLLATGPAMAHEAKMDYWFVEHFSVSQVDLPEGVSVGTSDPASTPRGYLVVENQTQTPLYVMPLIDKDLLVMVTPDPDWKTRLTLAHEAAAYLVLPERPAALTMEALVDLDASLVDRNVLSSDQPPEGLAIPTAQDSELLIVYDQQVIEVPFTITYTLNTRFNNDSARIPTGTSGVQVMDQASIPATQASITKTARLSENTIVLCLAAAVVLLTGGWVAWRVVRRGS